MYNLHLYKYFKGERLNTYGDISRMYTFTFASYLTARQITCTRVYTHISFVNVHN